MGGLISHQCSIAFCQTISCCFSLYLPLYLFLYMRASYHLIFSLFESQNLDKKFNLNWTMFANPPFPPPPPPALQFTPSSILFPNFRILSSCLFFYLNYSKLVYDILTYQKLRRKVDNLLYICPVKVCNKEGVNWGGEVFWEHWQILF